MSYGWAKDAEAMSTHESPIGWRQVASSYRDALHEEQRRVDELERRLARRSIDDVYLILLAICIVVTVLVALVA